MSKSDQDYYRRRAEQERMIADRCADGGVAHIHQQLADAYDAKLSRHKTDVPAARASS